MRSHAGVSCYNDAMGYSGVAACGKPGAWLARIERQSMRHGSHRGLGRERGQSLVEFALVLPIVLLMIFGLIEFGRVISAVLTTNHCAHELARYAVTGRTVAEVQAYALDPANPVCPPIDLDAPGAQFSVQVSHPAWAANDQLVEVIVIVEVPLVVPVIRDLFPGGTFPARGRASLFMERQIAP